MGLFIQTSYLTAAGLFILSLKWMSAPATARRGVLAGEVGMLLAIIGTLLRHEVVNYQWIGQFYQVGQTDVKLVNSFRVFTITYKCIVFYTFKL